MFLIAAPPTDIARCCGPSAGDERYLSGIHVSSGKLRALAVLTDTRSPVLRVPTH